MTLDFLALVRPSSWFDWWAPKPKDEVITYDIWDSIYPYSRVNSSRHNFSVMRHSGEQAEFIRSTFNKLDALIDVDFEEINYGYSSTYKVAQIEIYRTYSSNYSLWRNSSNFSMGGGIQGTYKSDRQFIHWRDVYESDSFSLYEKEAIVHEIGHALGLQHPHDNGYHSSWDDDDSVMSYNDGYSDALFFTDLDIKALQDIWGVEDDDQQSYQSYAYNFDESDNYKVVIGGSGNTFGNNSTTKIVNVDYKFIGGDTADVLKGYSGDNYGKDLLDGGEGADQLFGYRGADFLAGGAGDDELRAGNGRDIITGGNGGDTLYGGFGLNTYEDEADGEIDQLFFKSDQWEENWIYGTSGNSPNGEKADKIVELDEFDEIYVQGVSTSQLTYGFVEHDSRLGETLSGIGIYASGALEAVYVGDDLSLGQIAAMTQGLTSW